MKFDNWRTMYNYITDGNDLYNTETGDYVFEYNDAHALCVYHLSEAEAKMLAEKSKENEGEYWGASLGAGGEILDSSEYRYSNDENKRALYLQPSFDYCKEMYLNDNWINTIEYIMKG